MLARTFEALERRALLSATALVARDLNINGMGSDPFAPTAVSGGFVFAADDGTHGDELWFSDGTHASLVADIRPGVADSIVKNSPFIAAPGGNAYFFADDGVHGQELWRTDGTAAGTARVSDIQTLAINESPGQLTVAGGKIYFNARLDTFDRQLFMVDETAPGGVVKLTNFTSANDPAWLTAVGDTLFFTGGTADTGRELWATDGAPETTRMVEELTAGSTATPMTNLASAGGRLYFAASAAGAGNELWTSDGTADGTYLVKNIRSGTGNSDPRFFTTVGLSVYFTANGGSGVRLWRTNGTDAGTVPIADAVPGTTHSTPTHLTAFNGTLYFAGMTTIGGASQGNELWTVTPGGTAQLVTEVTPGPGYGVTDSLSASGGLLYFASGNQLYKSDGTAGGTQRVLDASFFSGVGTVASPAREIHGVTYLVLSTRQFGKQVFKTDGTAAGTVTTGTVDPRTASSAPTMYGKLGDTVFYSGDDGQGRQGLWADDGDETARFLGAFSFLGQFTEAGGLTYFTANDAMGGAELWRTDGTAAGTIRLLDNNAGQSLPQDLTAYNGMLLFSVAVSGGRELWRSHGTAATTVKVKGITPGADSLNHPVGFEVFGGYCYFSGTNANGAELWRTDGTPEGTAQFVDLASGSGSSSPLSLVATNTRLFFTASPILTQGQVLYATDGTPGGTGLVKSGIYEPEFMTALGDVLLFATVGVNDHAYGEELWRSDGTTAGTVMVKDLNPGPYSSLIGAFGQSRFVTVNGLAYFTASPANAAPNVLWRTDGTATGTFQVAAPGANAPHSYATAGGGKFFFVSGNQRWWESDGLSATAVSDVTPSSSFAPTVVATSNAIYYPANISPGSDYEPWKLSWAPFAALASGDDTLHVTGTGGHDQFALAADGGDIVVTLNGQALSFPAASVSAIRFAGGTGNDTLDFRGVPSGITVDFDGQVGKATININAGTFRFDENAAVDNPSLAVNVTAGGEVIFDATQYLAELNIAGGRATLTAGGDKVLLTRWLSVTDGGRLELNDNSLVLDEADPTRIGNWNGSGYGGVTGLLASAYTYGEWTGPGITSTAAGQSAGVTTLAPALASEVLFLMPGETAVWNGITVDATTVLIKYTYSGDANLDGLIDGADYGAIDNWVQFPGTDGYGNGDFNYDGLIDGADYGIIDNAIQFQGERL